MRNRSQDLITLLEGGPGKFSSTITGFKVTAYDENDDEIESKKINMSDTDNVQGAIWDFMDVVEFMKKHKDKVIELSEEIF